MGIIPLLTACGRGPINSHSTGIWDHGIVLNFSRAIVWLSKLFGNNYGWGIIAFTIIIRVLIMPLMWSQFKSMNRIQTLGPHVQAVERKYASRDTEDMLKRYQAKEWLSKQKSGNPLIGCLPVLLQIPIIWALYQAISRTHILETGKFLGIELGKADPHFILPIIAAALTLLSEMITTHYQNSNGMSGCSRVLLILVPIMILYGALKVPSALVLYWIALYFCNVLQAIALGIYFKYHKNDKKKSKSSNKNQKQKTSKKAKHNN